MSVATDSTHMTSTEAKQQAGRAYSVGGFICAAVALLFLPIIFGPIGAVLGFVGYSKGDKAGLWAGIAAIVATFLGFVIAAMVMGSNS